MPRIPDGEVLTWSDAGIYIVGTMGYLRCVTALGRDKCITYRIDQLKIPYIYGMLRVNGTIPAVKGLAAEPG
jgi:hypothetical protein